MRSAVAFFALLLLTPGCGASPSPPSSPETPASSSTAGPSSAPKGVMVELPSEDGKARGYLALPADKAAKHPAILVIQEWWGLDDWIKENTERFAAQGYVALAVDLYRGQVTANPEVAHELMRGLPEDRAIGDLEAGFSFLAARPDVDAQNIGAIGWCMGGGYALGFAAEEPRLAAVVMNYGRLITKPERLAVIKSPLMGNFAGEDRGIAPADVRAFDEALRATNKDVDIKIYEGAGHAFMNPNNKSGYDAAAARDAWSRIDTFFARKLKDG